MATRLEKVVIDISVAGDRELAQLAAQALLADKAVRKLSKTDLRAFNRDVAATGRAASTLARDVDRVSVSTTRMSTSTDRAGSSIDQLSGRLKLALDLFAMFGPATVPIAAVAVPALAGMTTGLAAAAVAGGSLVAATQGVGDAVKALEEARLEPTAANLEKAREAMALLGPDARQFARTWQTEALPMFRQIRDMSAAGWFPGLSEAVEELDVIGPKVGAIFEAVGRAGGKALADGADSLASDRWADDFMFAERELPEALTSLARIVGDLTHGFTTMWQELDPGSDAMLSWLEDVAQGFDRWANSAEGAEDIRGILDYAQENGPKVADLFTSLADTLAQLVQAAAPLGGPALQSLTAILRVVGGIADSDLGTPLLAGAAALAAYNRTLAVTTKLQQSAFGQGALGQALGGSIANRTDSMKASLAAARADLSSYAAAWTTAGARTEREQARMAASAASLRSNLGTLAGQAGRVVGPVAGIGVVASGAADDIGLTNTASLALIGSMAGWPGAIGGAAVGAVVDLAASNNELEASIRDVDRAAAEMDFSALRSNAEGIQTALNDASNVGGVKDFLDDLDAVSAAALSGDFNLGSTLEAEAERAEAALLGAERAIGQIGVRLDASFGTSSSGLSQAQVPIEELEAVALRAAPAMEALGYTFDDLRQMDSSELQVATDRIAAWVARSDTAAGRTEEVAAAVENLGNEAETAATRADRLGAALDQLLSPQLNLSEATDAWTMSLRSLADDLAQGSKTLTGNTNAALKNREALRGRVMDMQNLLRAEAEAGASPERLTRNLLEQREALMRTGVAAGVSRKQMSGFLDQLGLTPKMVQTIVRQVGAEDAAAKVRALQRLVDQYGLTRAQAQALLKDAASGRIKSVQDLIDKYGVSKKTASALLDDLASGKLQGLMALMQRVDGTTARTTTTHEIVTVHRDVRVAGRAGVSANPTHNAAGGLYDQVRAFRYGGFRDPLDRADAHPPMVSAVQRLWGEPETHGEAYIPFANDWRRPRAVAIWEEAGRRLGVQFQRYAAGGVREAVRPLAPRYAAPSAPSINLPPVQVSLAGHRLILETDLGPIVGRVADDRIGAHRAHASARSAAVYSGVSDD